MSVVLYGCTGYTGRLLAQAAAARGLPVRLSGRDPERVAQVAAETGLPHEAVALEDSAGLDRLLRGARVVLHAAGPFVRTSAPMIDAALRAGVHYLDITGELDVFRAAHARDGEAKARGVALIPGVGFDIVPTDAIAAHVHRLLPDATHLQVAISAHGGGMSSGTLRSALPLARAGAWVRRDGVMVSTPFGAVRGSIDFGRGARPTLAVPLADVFTAWFTTGIPNIEAHAPLPGALRRAPWLLGPGAAALRVAASDAARPLVEAWLARRAPGPSPAQRADARIIVVAVARSAERSVQARWTTPEGYTLTVETALTAAMNAVAGDIRPGFGTPAGQWGPEIATERSGVVTAE
jgi:short subunit dehydrogenase-like uncharacterized protein